MPLHLDAEAIDDFQTVPPMGVDRGAGNHGGGRDLAFHVLPGLTGAEEPNIEAWKFRLRRQVLGNDVWQPRSRKAKVSPVARQTPMRRCEKIDVAGAKGIEQFGHPSPIYPIELVKDVRRVPCRRNSS